MRKIITPAFHFKILEQFIETFDRIGNTLIKNHLSKYDKTEEFEIYPLAVMYTLDVMCGNYFILLCFYTPIGYKSLFLI